MIFKKLTRAKLTSFGVALFIAGSSVPVSAAVLNFAAYIDNTSLSGGEKAVQSTFDLGGFTITAHGFNSTVGTGDFTNGPYAYFDGDNAGIGVCQEINSTKQCTTASDDNVTGNSPTEILSISFNQAVRVSSYFRNDGHTPNFGTNKYIDVSVGGSTGPYSDTNADKWIT